MVNAFARGVPASGVSFAPDFLGEKLLEGGRFFFVSLSSSKEVERFFLVCLEQISELSEAFSAVVGVCLLCLVSLLYPLCLLVSSLVSPESLLVDLTSFFKSLSSCVCALFLLLRLFDSTV